MRHDLKSKVFYQTKYQQQQYKKNTVQQLIFPHVHAQDVQEEGKKSSVLALVIHPAEEMSVARKIGEPNEAYFDLCWYKVI